MGMGIEMPSPRQPCGSVISDSVFIAPASEQAEFKAARFQYIQQVIGC